jgi:guanine deaminase
VVPARARDDLRRGPANAIDPDDALAKAFTLGTPGDVAGVWVDGTRLER